MDYKINRNSHFQIIIVMNKLRIGVIFGGPSSEREVSLESGRHLFQSVDPERFEAIPLFMSSNRQIWEIPIKLVVMNTTKDIEDQLAVTAKRIPYEQLKERIDFMLIGLHGKFGEDGCLQGLLELLGIPYSGSGVLASAIGMNKDTTRRIVRTFGVTTPEYHVIRSIDWHASPESIVEHIKKTFALPVVVKPIAEGCSTAVEKIVAWEDLAQRIDEALQWDPFCMIDEYIEGVEITTTVIGNDTPKSFEITETPPAFGHYVLTLEDKFLPGGAEMITPARLHPEDTKRYKEIMVLIFGGLHLKGYTRIDGFVRNNEFIFNEVNTLPGATPSTCLIQQAAHDGLRPMDLVSKIIDLGLEAHANKIGPL